MKKSLVLVACLAAVSTACSIDVRGAGVMVTEQKTFPVTGNPDLTLRTFDGSVEIRSWDRKEVSVEIQRRGADPAEANALEVQTRQEGDRIVLDATGNKGRRVIHVGNWQGRSVSFIVQAPRNMTLTVETGDGSITASQLSGKLSLQSGDGSIRGDHVEGEISAHTGDGSIAITGAQGLVSLNTGDGSVRLSGRLEDLRVHTGDGSVSIDLDEGSAMKTDWSLTTGDGSVSVNLPARFDADVEADSGDGHVSANWDRDPAREEHDEDRRRFRGRLGAGGRRLSVRTGDGSITLSAR